MFRVKERRRWSAPVEGQTAVAPGTVPSVRSIDWTTCRARVTKVGQVEPALRASLLVDVLTMTLSREDAPNGCIVPLGIWPGKFSRSWDRFALATNINLRHVAPAWASN